MKWPEVFSDYFFLADRNKKSLFCFECVEVVAIDHSFHFLGLGWLRGAGIEPAPGGG
jgi:hypothetical protein